MLFYLKHDINNIAITKVVAIEDALQVLDVVINHCRESGERPANNIMSTIDTTVKSIRLVNTENGVYYRTEFNSEFDAVVNNNGTYAEGKVNYINFAPKALIAQVLANVAGADILYARRHESAVRNGTADFGVAELSAILRNAKISLEREKFEAGSEYEINGETHTHEFAGYNTQITSIEVSERVAHQMDALTDSVLSI